MPLTQTRWPFFVALAGGVFAVSALWFFVLSNPSGEAVPASGGRYVEGVTRPPDRINPLFANANATDRDLASLIFSGLVTLSPDGTPLPDLAERWEITGNGQSYVFHLREGVAWQDEEKTRFDADDVVFTFDAISDPEFKGDPALAQLMRGVVVSARDSYTVEFKLEQAYAPFLAFMTVGMLPEHLLRDLDADGLYNAEFNARPIGTGPYQFQGRTNSSIVLESNSTYYFGPPRISTLELRVFGDESAVAAALRDGDIDGSLLSPQATSSDIDFLRSGDRFSLQELTGTSLHVVYLDTRSPLFDDVDVRTALFRTINPASLIEKAADGRGVPADTGIPGSSWAYTQVEVPSFDAGEAARALENAGWSRGRDGVRRKGDARLSFTLSTSNEVHRVAIAENVATQLRSVGADVTIQALDAATFIDEHLLPRRFEAALVEIDLGADPDPYPFWHSSQIVPPGRNLANYADPRFDDALERARQTTDIARRTELYALFEGMLIAEMPALPLYTPVYTYVQDTNVRGFTASLLFTPAWRFANVREWFVETRVP